jgi:predicted component of type VI protein secretion system
VASRAISPSSRRFSIGIHSKHARALVVQEITQRAKLASHGDIDFVLSRNVSGICVNACERAPPEVPTRPWAHVLHVVAARRRRVLKARAQR